MTDTDTQEKTDTADTAAGVDAAASTPYRVLARKYRPSDFSGLIGQEVLVRTLSNAIAMDRIAHAFLLTGIRGIGKTTTARIIARALNCIGTDGKSGPTTEPCGVCEHCTAIAADRHVDVLEMDAASRTGVGDIREIIENVQYKPVSARYKIYIIDEVHMLSNSAFNALLKTLEEPPPHVKFIFATTEIRKIPVTVLSRCQRFDLRRVEGEELQAHLKNICDKEGIEAEDAALAMIARAAEGSVRDALSLLDQAIAHASGGVTAALVQDMVGLSDRARLFDLYDLLMQGKVSESLEVARQLYREGGDPLLLLNDLLDLTHFLTRLKISPSLKEDVSLPEADRQRGAEMVDKLAMPALGRCWQMLLKGAQEIKQAPSPLQALEMVLIRLAYVAELPTPEGLLQAGGGQGVATGAPQATAPAGAVSSAAPAMASAVPAAPAAPVTEAPTMSGRGAVRAVALQPEPVMQAVSLQEEPEEARQPVTMPQDFPALVALFMQQREPLLHAQLHDQVRLVRYKPGQLELLAASEHLPADFPNRVSRALQQWTGERWMVSMVTSAVDAAPTLNEQTAAAWEKQKTALAEEPDIKAVLEAFPGAEIIALKPRD